MRQSDLLIHLFLSIEMSRVISSNNLNIHFLVLARQSFQPRISRDKDCIHTFDNSPTINGSFTLATLPLVMMITLKSPSYWTGLCSADMNGFEAFVLFRGWLFITGLEDPA
jgi:hypothetical protein